MGTTGMDWRDSRGSLGWNKVWFRYTQRLLTVKNGCFEFWRTLFSVSVWATSSWKKKRATQECLWNSHKSLPFRYRLPHPPPLLPLTYFCYDHLLLQDLHGVVASCGLLLYQDDFAKSAFSQEFEVFKVVHSLEEPEERKWHLVTNRGINKLML